MINILRCFRVRIRVPLLSRPQLRALTLALFITRSRFAPPRSSALYVCARAAFVNSLARDP